MTRPLLLALAFAVTTASLPNVAVAEDVDLRLVATRESLTGTHYRYQQYIDGRPVIGAGSVTTITSKGERLEERVLATLPAGSVRPRRGQVILNDRGVARIVERTVRQRRDLEAFAEYRDADTGSLVRVEPLFLNAKEGSVFESNPVVRLNAPQLRDENDSPAAVPQAAYSVVELLSLEAAGPLRGPWVRIGDFELPATTRADAASSLVFDRSVDAFEEVNSYFHIDRTQRYLQSLGYVGSLAVVPYPIDVDPHGAAGLDNSYYIPGAEPGRGVLVFGDGGTDDAEDPDLLVHEYAHAIQDWIAPGVFTGEYSSESRALGEALGDYWAFSAKYVEARRSGRDPYCIADWDARCGSDAPSERCAYAPDANCLRRVDSVRTYAEFSNSNTPGTEHRNGEMVSSALREFFESLVARHGVAEGKRRADTIVVESLFGTAPAPTFASFQRRLVLADQLLFGGAAADVLCATFEARGLATCAGRTPRGEVTVFTSAGSDLPIPDNNPAGLTSSIVIPDTGAIRNVSVHVDIEHPFRGDLRVVLVAPDGTEVLLLASSSERARDLVTVFGRDTRPAASLDVLRGRSASGVWTLRVFDTNFRDSGVLRSWSLLLQLEGDEPAAVRPAASATAVYLPVAGSVAGVNSSRYYSELTLANTSSHDSVVRLTFTPSTANGLTEFASAEVVVPAQSTLVYPDVVATVLSSSGMGQLEIDGDVVVSSRIVTARPRGTSFQSVPAFPRSAAAARGIALTVGPVNLGSGAASTRANAGFAELNGAPGLVRVSFIDASTRVPLAVRNYTVEAFSHRQFPVEGCTNCSVLVQMEVVEGEAAIVGYGSVIDNQSGEAMFVAGTRPDSAFANDQAQETWTVRAGNASTSPMP